MNRDHQFDFDFPEEQRREEASGGGGGRAGGGGNTDAGPDTNDRDRDREDRDRREIPGLSDKEARVLRAVGAFRMVDGDHLPRRAVDSLVRQGLATRDRAYLRLNEPKREIVALTRKGLKVARANRSEVSSQRYYARVVRIREIRHDLALYPEFRKNAKEIEANGGHIQRVVLDYEMKSIMAKRMNAPPAGHVGEFRGVDDETKAARRREVAAELDLPIVEGRLKLPDARIEYEDVDGQSRHLDLEVVTEQYRGRPMATKKQAGFKMSGVKDSRAAVKDDHHHNFF